jgi:Methylase of polypeptide chain release factors
VLNDPVLSESASRDEVSRLRSDLEAARYTVDTLEVLWGEGAAAALSRGHRVPAERAVAGVASGSVDAAAATLARMFVLGLPAPVDAVSDALGTLGVGGAAALGLVGVHGDIVRPLVDLRPYAFVDADGAGHWWIASDLGELAMGGALAEEHVLGIGGASVTLSGLMIGEPVDRVLDLGTGCGIQALHAARHARVVVATDISQRAIRFARLNADLNEVVNIDFRVGDLFVPVAGESFDRIVSNPPFVITPRSPDVPAYEYRDGGMVGDALVEAMIRGAAEHLVPGGVAQLLGNWEYRADALGLERVGRWLDEQSTEYGGDRALDAWIVEREVQDPAEYSETWIRDGGTRPGTPEFERLYRAWLDDFDARGVTAVGFGYFTLHRPSSGSPTLRRLERVESHGVNDAGLGEHVAAFLAAHDWQAGLDDEWLRTALLTAAPDVTEERHYWPGADDPTVIALHVGGGLGRVVPVDTALAAFVGACDGELTVGAIIAAIAQLSSVDETALLGDLLPRVRELIEIGVLLPPELLPGKPAG